MSAKKPLCQSTDWGGGVGIPAQCLNTPAHGLHLVFFSFLTCLSKGIV